MYRIGTKNTCEGNSLVFSYAHEKTPLGRGEPFKCQVTTRGRTGSWRRKLRQDLLQKSLRTQECVIRNRKGFITIPIAIPAIQERVLEFTDWLAMQTFSLLEVGGKVSQGF